MQSGKIWVSYDTSGQSAIGEIDPSAVTPFQTEANMGGWYSAPELAADPQDTGVLIAALPGISPSSVAGYNTTVEPATVRAQSNFFENCSNEKDLAVVPGGAEFILACGAPYAHYRYSTTDLSQQGSYASIYYPDAVAIDASGDVAAGVSTIQTNPDVHVYHSGGDTPLNTYNLNASGRNLSARGLAWSADGSKLFAVLVDSSSAYSVQVINDPTLIRPTLTLATGASVFTYEPTVHVTAHLGTTFSNRTVSIYADPFGTAPRVLLKKAMVNSSGNLTVSYKAPHSTTFSVVFSGDAKYGARTVTHTVQIRAKVSEALGGYYGSSVIRGVTYRLFHHTSTLRALAVVAPNKAGQCVKFETQVYYQGAWRANGSTKCGTLNSSSKVGGLFTLTNAPLGYHFRIRADYFRSAKDTTNLNNSSAWLYLIIEK